MSLPSSTAGSTALRRDRDLVLQEAGHSVPLVNIDDFCHHWLPRVPQLSEATILKIIDDVSHGPAYVARRWAAFARDPTDCLDEHTVFKAIVPVVSAVRKVVAAHAPDLEPTTEFLTVPSDPPISTVRRNDSRPDAYFVVKDPRRYDSTKPACWLDIAVAGEFNKGDMDYQTDDDVKKALWNMHHTNREDARRQRLFAFTIENRTMRLWCADHSIIVASDSFDFMDEPEHLIRFIIAFSYAPLENMGFDPTMTLDWDGRPLTKPQYLITVQSRISPGIVKTYKTTKVLYALGAEAIRGRGTRVWTVREWVDGEMCGEELVLKDCWVDMERDVEGEVMERLERAAKSPEDKEELAEILLTVLIDGVVCLQDGTINKTVHGAERARLIAYNARFYRIARLPSPCVSIGSSEDDTSFVDGSRDPADATKLSAPLTFPPPKKRYRIAFAEICEPLNRIPHMEHRMWALSRASWGLGILHKLGWVHRDMSAGNIMVFGDTVKIADLEYAQEMDNQTVPQARAARTGTEDYMSVEVAQRKYLFRIGAVQQDTQGPAKQAVREFIKARKRRVPSKSATLTAKRETINLSPWFYNPLHDMESIEWIAIETVLHHNPVCKFPRNLPFRFEYKEGIIQRWERLVNASNGCHGLFVERSERWSLMVCDGDLAETLSNTLHPALQPLASKFVGMRNFLVKNYRKAEKYPGTIDRGCAEDVCMFFARTLMEIADHIALLECDMRLQPLSSAANKMPQRYKDMIVGWESPGSIAISRKRVRNVEFTDESAAEDEGDEDLPPAKSPRISLDHSPHGFHGSGTSPTPASRSHIPQNDERRRNTVAPPPPTRTLRSHVQSASLAKIVPRPHSQLIQLSSRPRKSQTIAGGRGNVEKDYKAPRAVRKARRTRKGDDK